MPSNLTPKNVTTGGSTMSGALGGTTKPEDEEEGIAPSETPQMGGSTAPSTIGGGKTSPSVKAMPKQQKAGTGTFANLKSYLQAAQGGGRVSQAATQRVQNLTGQAQKGIGKAQETFGAQMQAGSLKGMDTATEEAKKIIGVGTGVTYQAPQPAPVEPRKDINPPRMGINPPDYDFWKDKTRNPDGTITYKDGTPLVGKSLAEFAEKQQIDAGKIITLPAIERMPTQSTAPGQPQQYFTPEQQQRFAEIINAHYQGPQSLQQAGLYEQAAKRAQVAQQALQQTQSAAGREQLLRDVYGRNREYTRGQSKLDALLLNASQPAVQELQQQAQQAGNIQQQLQEAQNLSANEAARRAETIQGISSGARTAFTTARTAEEAASNQYIQDVLANWDKLPEYFKKTLTEAQTKTGATGNKDFDYYTGSKNQGNTYNLSREEAQILGLTPGQGLFGVTPDKIQAAQRATGSELITKDQLSRQLALSQLAELDKSRALQKDLMYTDLEKAGTKDIFSSLDTQKLKAIQDENRKAMEKELVGKSSALASTEDARLAAQMVSLGRRPTDARYQDFNWMDILKRGGYTPTDMEGFTAEGQAQNLLRGIAEGQAYSPTEGATNVPGYLQKAYESMAPTTQNVQLGNWALTPIQSVMQKYGGTDIAQVVEDDKTKARATALRELLSGIYKK